ncbi:hypothetical protein [Nonomuraea sp. B19D2]|uniref:hypothetical protein n=1 Tax=Nonomuraea sp. B19D2 TaxID=3159561 RepID=UPI0032DAA23F
MFTGKDAGGTSIYAGTAEVSRSSLQKGSTAGRAGRRLVNTNERPASDILGKVIWSSQAFSDEGIE